MQGALAAVVAALIPSVASAQFAPPATQNAPAVSGLVHIVSADLNGDGDRDLLAADAANDRVLVWANNPTGTFSGAPSAIIPCPAGARPFHLASGDLDNDPAGTDDLVICEPGLNQMAIVFQPSGVRITLAGFGGGRPIAATVMDNDRDGRNDVSVIVQPAGGGAGRLFAVQQTGPMTFAIAGAWATQNIPQDLVALDLDGDTWQDVAVANQGSGTISLFQNAGTPGVPNFITTVQPSTVIRPERLAKGDFDCNGFEDVAVTSRSNGVETLAAQGPVGAVNVLNNPIPVPTLALFRDIAVGDIDCDGQYDLVIAEGSIPPAIGRMRILRNQGGGVFGPVVSVNSTGVAFVPAIDISDLTGEGTPDVAFLNDSANTIDVFANECPICCHIYEGGISDQFNPTSPLTSREPSCPCPPVAAWAAGLPVNPYYDQPSLNTHFIESFGTLPRPIIAASLEIRIRSQNLAAVGDAVFVGFDPGPAQWAFQRRLAQLADTNYSWGGVQTATLRFDLQNMPGGMDLLPLLNKIRCIDLDILDNTTVDYVRFRMTSRARSNCNLNMRQSPYIAGQATGWSVSNANPGELVALLFKLGQPGMGPCLPLPFSGCFCLDNSASVVGVSVANGFGNANFSLNIPALPFPPCIDITSQAVALPSSDYGPTWTARIH